MEQDCLPNVTFFAVHEALIGDRIIVAMLRYRVGSADLTRDVTARVVYILGRLCVASCLR